MIFEFTGENEFSEDFPLMIGDLLLIYFFWDGDIQLSMVVLDVKDAHEDLITVFNVDTNEFVDIGYHGILRSVSCVIRK